MQDQARRRSEPLQWGRREKTVVAVLLSCVALALIGLGTYAATTGAPPRADCIHLTFASTLGGAELNDCGSQARGICASPGAFHAIAGELRAACKRAGYPYGAG